MVADRLDRLLSDLETEAVLRVVDAMMEADEHLVCTDLVLVEEDFPGIRVVVNHTYGAPIAFAWVVRQLDISGSPRYFFYRPGQGQMMLYASSPSGTSPNGMGIRMIFAVDGRVRPAEDLEYRAYRSLSSVGIAPLNELAADLHKHARIVLITLAPLPGPGHLSRDPEDVHADIDAG